jgi:hypothetical protein
LLLCSLIYVQQEKDPTYVLRHAIAGNIKKNKLKVPRLNRLKIYADHHHNHEAQFVSSHVISAVDDDQQIQPHTDTATTAAGGVDHSNDIVELESDRHRHIISPMSHLEHNELLTKRMVVEKHEPTDDEILEETKRLFPDVKLTNFSVYQPKLGGSKKRVKEVLWAEREKAAKEARMKRKEEAAAKRLKAEAEAGTASKENA